MNRMQMATKILRVSIVGSPNAGKSTLLNCFFPSQQQIAAVSPKYNTTREQYRGVFTDMERQTQIIFTDTPGIVQQAENRKRYFRTLVTEAVDSIDQESIDIVLLVVDAAAKLSNRRKNSMLKVRDLCIQQNVDLFLILNKIDYIKNKRELLPLTNSINDILKYEEIDIISKNVNQNKKKMEKKKGKHNNNNEKKIKQSKKTNKILFNGPSEVHYISAKENDDGVDILKESLFNRAYEGEWQYDEDEFTELDDNDIIAEIIREQLFQTYQKEIPYIVEQMTTNKDHITPEHLLLEQTFYVPRESMRRVLHRKNFSVINKIRKKCEKRLTELYNELYGYEKVTLRLVVKLKKSR